MKKEKKTPKITPLQRVIRILILAIFIVSLLIAMGRLMEWNQKQKELDRLEQQKQGQEQQDTNN